MNAIGTKQQDRGERARTVLFNYLTQDIQNLLQRSAGRDHPEETLFTDEQGLSSLALGDVNRGAGIIMDFAGLLHDGSAHALDMLNRSVRKRDSKFQVKSPFLFNCFIETSLNK